MQQDFAKMDANAIKTLAELIRSNPSSPETERRIKAIEEAIKDLKEHTQR